MDEARRKKEKLIVRVPPSSLQESKVRRCLVESCVSLFLPTEIRQKSSDEEIKERRSDEEKSEDKRGMKENNEKKIKQFELVEERGDKGKECK